MTALPVLADELTQRGGSGDLVGKELLYEITHAIKHAPRSTQRMIGPSEIGDPCQRRIAYKLLGFDELRDRPIAWKAFIGTGTHLALADVFTPREVETGQERWYVETKLVVGQLNGVDVTGTCDLYDRVTGTVIDWKTTSRAKIDKLRKSHDPGEAYRAQIMLYGRGWRLAGHPVDKVMIVFLPRDADLDQAYVWHAAYDEQAALDALVRLSSIELLVRTFGVDVLAMLPTTEAYCAHCAFHVRESSNLAMGCPGDPAMPTTEPPLKVRKG